MKKHDRNLNFSKNKELNARTLYLSSSASTFISNCGYLSWKYEERFRYLKYSIEKLRSNEYSLSKKENLLSIFLKLFGSNKIYLIPNILFRKHLLLKSGPIFLY